MFKIDGPNALPALPAPAAPGVPGYFSEGNPATGVPAVQVSADWLNAVQEEITSLVTGAGLALDKGDQTQMMQAVGAMIAAGASTLPPGSMVAYTGQAVPSGWLKANGAAISRVSYADLFAAIGITYGAGDGVSTFNLPETRGEFLRGWDDGRGIDAARALGSTQTDAFQGHAHEGLRTTYWNNGIAGGGNPTSSTPGTTNGAPISQGAFGTPRTAAETRPRNLAVQFIIKF